MTSFDGPLLRQEQAEEQYVLGYEDGMDYERATMTHDPDVPLPPTDPGEQYRQGFEAGRAAWYRDEPCDCACHMLGRQGRERLYFPEYPDAPPEGEWCCDPCNRQPPPTAADLERLRDQVTVMADALRWRAEQHPTRYAWEAATALSRSLHDIHGAYGALALEEQAQAQRATASSTSGGSNESKEQ